MGTLLNFIQDGNHWEKTSTAEHADVCIYINEKKLDYQLANYTLINRIPGIRFLARKIDLNIFRDENLYFCFLNCFNPNDKILIDIFVDIFCFLWGHS